MRHYGRALARCTIGDATQPGGGHAEALAAACHRFAAATHQREQRLGRLAGATADTVAVLQPELTAAGRWAITVAIADTASELAARVNGATPLQHLAAKTALRHLHRRIGDTQRVAAAHPPTCASQAILDRPIPVTLPFDPATRTTQVLASAAAGIVHHTSPGQPIALCELLAVTIAMESLTETAARLLGTLDTHAPDRRAADARRAVQHQLHPFNDGTRRPQADTPPVVGCALDLHRALPRPDKPTTRNDLIATHDALHHTPTISRNLISAVQRWADTNALFGYACDIPTGPWHVTAYLAGHRPEGVITAGLPELHPTMILIAGAATTTHQLTTNLTKAFCAPSRDRVHRMTYQRVGEPLALDTEPLAPRRPL
jgi:hypothetical protein